MAPTNDLVEKTETQQLIEYNREAGWPDILVEDKGIAVTFVQCSYSVKETADELNITQHKVRMAIKKPLVASYISALQADDHTINMVNKQFVASSMMRLIPKLMGEEDVPIVLKDGEEVWRKKFHAADLRAVLEYLGSHTDFKSDTKGGDTGGVNVQINFGDVMSESPEVKVVGNEDG